MNITNITTSKLLLNEITTNCSYVMLSNSFFAVDVAFAKWYRC